MALRTYYGMTISTIPKLFQPIRIGMANPQYRVVMALMARFRVAPTCNTSPACSP